MEEILQVLKGLGDSSRFRIFFLCSKLELTVSELVRITGLSQSRVSQQLNILVKSKILERNQEGNWAYFRLYRESPYLEILLGLNSLTSQTNELSADHERLLEVRKERDGHAQEYFQHYASKWNHIRSLYVNNNEIEKAILTLIQKSGAKILLDIGTGTGRILEISAQQVDFAIGIDCSKEMLAIARSTLDKHEYFNCQVRHADMYRIPFKEGKFDVVTLHMVLHYASNPKASLQEACRTLRGGGQIIVVDFSSHEMEELQDKYAHRWLGFEDAYLQNLLRESGFENISMEQIKGEPLTTNIWSAEKKIVNSHAKLSH
ncbi:MAG: metalloregulator ArsR/SmtB family transcription factor [bacterium]|nr:metalloregulator ArsR/SmtB family transcription factor [bacterium]